MFYTVVATRAGWVGLLATSQGLARATLPLDAELKARIALGQKAARATESAPHFRSLAAQYCDYFEGRKVAFAAALDLAEFTQFQRDVWQAVRDIPYGATRSYRDIAVVIGKPGAARAVGQALGRNPVPVIVPCHRVLAHSGALGGFGGGLAMKRYLLALEQGTVPV